MDKKDMFMTGVKATISAVPVVGGSFASIISDVYSDRKEAKLTEFIENFKVEMEDKYGSDKLDAAIVKSFVENEEFLDIFENLLIDILHQRTKEKRSYLRHLLINSITKQSATYDKTESFQRILNQVTVQHLLILSAFYDCREIHMQQLDKDLDVIMMCIKEKVDGLPEETIKELIRDLESLNLVNYFTHNQANRLSGAPMYGDHPYITEKGREFYRYIVLEPQSVDADHCERI